MVLSQARDDRISAGSLTFHYVQWGEHGQPIVCVHGITANAFCFQALADELARDHRVIAYDLRGRGDSDKPDHGYSIPIHAADLAEVMDALKLERPVLVGHSLGAFISLHFATHYPDKLSKLVLIDGGTPLAWKSPDERPGWLTGSIGRLGTPVPSFDEYIQRLKAAPFLGPYWNHYLDIYFEHDVRFQNDGSVISKSRREGAFEDLLYLEEENEPQQQWAKVQVPTLLLHAGQGLFSDDDQLVTEEYALAVQRDVKDNNYVKFPALNHYTIIFGIDSGPAREIRSFVDKE